MRPGNEDLVEEVYKACSDLAPSPQEVKGGNPKVKGFNDCVRGKLDENQELVKKFQKEVGQGAERLPSRKRRSLEQDLLSKYMQDRFEKKARNTKQGNGEQKIVDHALYFDFYQSQLTKMVTLAINSYCMYADVTTANIQYLDRRIAGDKSVNAPLYFKLAGGDQRATFKKNKELLAHPARAQLFLEICARGISRVCHELLDGKSKQTACRVLSTLRRLNRAITANEKRIDYVQCRKKFKGKEHCGKGGFSNVSVGPGKAGKALEFYDPNIKGQSIDDLTALTASEFHANIVEKIEEVCPEKGGASDEKCLEQLKLIVPEGNIRQSRVESNEGGKGDEDKKILAEFQIQTEIVQRGIAGYEEEDLAREIAAEGGDIEKIIQGIEDKSGKQIKALREKMKERYGTEREASLKRLAERLSRKSGPFEEDEVGLSGKIISDIKNKNKGVEQLLFFNNVITGYLYVKEVGEDGEKNKGAKSSGKKGTVRRNLASFKREIEQATDDKPPAGLEQKFVKERLAKQLSKLEKEEESNSKDGSNPQASNPTFTPRDIYDNFLGDKEAYQEGLEGVPGGGRVKKAGGGGAQEEENKQPLN